MSRPNQQYTDIDALHGLKEVHFDFEKMEFTINGVNIGHCTDVDISFHDRIWTVKLGEQANFTTLGEFVGKRRVKKEKSAAETTAETD